MGWKLKVFYDGACPLCSREIAWLQKRTHPDHVLYEDIERDDFTGPEYGISREQALAQIHGVSDKSEILTGMNLFRALYREAGLGWLLIPTGWPLMRPLFDWLYQLFARNRLRLTGRAGACNAERCE